MAPGRPRAIIVDLDDTILDSGDPEVSWRAICAEFAANFDVAPGCLFDALIDARDWFWDDHLLAREGRLDLLAARRTIFSRALLSLGLADAKPAAADAMAERYTALRDEAVTPFPGALSALERLRESGIQLALLTNGSSEKQWAQDPRSSVWRTATSTTSRWRETSASASRMRKRSGMRCRPWPCGRRRRGWWATTCWPILRVPKRCRYPCDLDRCPRQRSRYERRCRTGPDR